MSILNEINEATNNPTARDNYHVSLSDFYGPMDLLLSLIEQEEMEITEIALAQITDSYLGYLTALKEISPDNLTDFLVVASKLILIKSQVLLPRPPSSIVIDEGEDEADDLVRQLKDYKRFKLLAQDLQKIEKKNQRQFIRLHVPQKIEPKLRPGEADVSQLLQAVRRALTVKPKEPDVDTVVSRQEVTIGEQINMIYARLNHDQRLKFETLLSDAHSRVEIIVTLLAVLELLKRRMINVEQQADFGEIMLVRRENAEIDESDWVDLESMTDLS